MFILPLGILAGAWLSWLGQDLLRMYHTEFLIFALAQFLALVLLGGLHVYEHFMDRKGIRHE